MAKHVTDRRRAQFELERQLRERILRAAPKNRAEAIGAAYTELFQAFPDHSRLRASQEQRLLKGKRGAGIFLPLTKPGDAVLEIGCGTGHVLAELARHGRKCVGVEPSVEMISLCPRVPDLRIVLGTADRLDFPPCCFDLAFSQQVLEHLHPDDVPVHLAECYRVLRPGGVLCIETPNARAGPQDISRGFVPVAQGLHLKEWSVAELIVEFRRAGFRRIQGLLAPPFLARRSSLIHKCFRVSATVKWLQDLALAAVPGLSFRTLVGKVIGLEDILLFGHKPLSGGS